MRASDFVNVALEIAQNVPTLYVKGCFGAPLPLRNASRYINQYAYNKSREEMIYNACDNIPIVFGFDCVCLIKAILWGWFADADDEYGGARYLANNVPDITEDDMIQQCEDMSADFSYIVPGEVVWLKGHIGIYIGGNKVVECTPSWENGVQITRLGNVDATGTYRIWQLHGKLPYVDYNTDIAEDIMNNTPNEWAKDAVEWALDNGILYGDENGDLKLRDSCTREMMCVFLKRLYDLVAG